MQKTRPNATACPVCARLERAWEGIPLFERPQCLRCFRARHGRPLLVPAPSALAELPARPMLHASPSLTPRQVDHRYRMLDHLRRQAQIAARRVLEAAG